MIFALDGVFTSRSALGPQIDTPVKDVRLTGRRLIKDYENGLHKFSLNGQVAGQDVSGELEVDTSSPGAELKLNYKPGESQPAQELQSEVGKSNIASEHRAVSHGRTMCLFQTRWCTCTGAT